MRTRVLPESEWSRLPQEWSPTVPHLQPTETQIVVVEDGEQIVACWGVLRLVHLEGLWIDPAYRTKPGVAVRLYRGAMRAVRSMAKGWVLTGASDDDVRGLLDRAGAVRLPMDVYVMPVTGED